MYGNGHFGVFCGRPKSRFTLHDQGEGRGGANQRLKNTGNCRQGYNACFGSISDGASRLYLSSFG